MSLSTRSTYRSGFTLLELIVALGLFGFIGTAGVAALITLSNSNFSAQISRKTIDSIDFVLDDIVREHRLGKNYHCNISNTPNDANPLDCGLGATTTALTRLEPGAVGDVNIVRYSTSTINGKSVLMKEVTDLDGDTTCTGCHAKVQLSGTDIDIKYIRFYVHGTNPNDSLPAQILVSLQAELKKGTRFSTTVNLQTTIVQRAPDK
jgi:prepilin-type N-terminal cleavage/methylation domain-containing protein